MPELIAFLAMSSILIVVLTTLWLRFRNRQLQHQERMAALEKGAALIPAIGADAPWSPRVYLLRGLIWTFTGVALTIALFAVGLTAQTHRQSLSAEVLAAQARNVSQSLNISIEEARAIVNKDEAARVNQESGTPLALALFGLIPLGVGLAYLVYYRATPPGPQA